MPEPELKRHIGLVGATSLGIANIIGAGIFVLSGVAAGLAGPSVVLSFFIAGGVALLTALSSAELASFVNETGASYAFTKRAFGKLWSFLVGWFKYFDYIVGAAAVSIGFATYFVKLLGLNSDVALLVAMALPLALTILNLVGVREATFATSILVAIKLVALILLISVAGYYIFHHPWRGHFTPFFPMGVNGTFHGAAIIFFAFLGFNTVAMMTEETKNPSKTLPRALMLAFGVSFVMYCLIAFVEIGALDWKSLGTSASPLEDLAATVSSSAWLKGFIGFSALVATGSVVLSSIIGGTRAGFAMGRDRVLPSMFAQVSKKNGTPNVSIIVSGIIIIVLAGAFYRSIDVIASIFNFGSLFTYFFVQLSLMKLRKTEPGTVRPFKVPLYPVVPIVGAISCVLLMYYLSNTAKIASVIWLFVGLGFYVFMARRLR